MTLENRQLGKTDLRVSAIGLGCVTFGREIDAAASFEVLDRAAEQGINFLDTAAIYGDGASEEIVGRWLQTRRPQGPVIVATKVSGRLTHGNVICSVEGSLRRLGVERIDLLYAHDWDRETPFVETLEAFEQLTQKGEIRYSGCSNWSAGQIEQALLLADRCGWRRLAAVQSMYNLVERGIEHALLPLCARHDLGVVAYSPIGAGFLTGKYRQGESIPLGTRFDVKPGHQRIYFTDRRFRVMEGLRRIAAEAGESMAHLALSWALQRPSVTSVLIGARNATHVDQAFRALESPPCREIMERVETLAAVSDDSQRADNPNPSR